MTFRQYVAVTFVTSWAGWVTLAALGVEPFGMPGVLLFALGGIGPAVGGVALTVREGQAARREYLDRLVNPSRISLRWWAVALGLTPVLVLVGGLLASVADIGTVSAGPLRELLGTPIELVGFLGFTLVFGPLPEELGWRGYALDRLLATRGPLVASVALGSVWWVWHLPLFFVTGTFQAELGVGTLEFWLFGYNLVANSVVYTLVHRNTARSTLAAVAFHFSVNVTGELLAWSRTTDLLVSGLLTLVVVGIVGRWVHTGAVRTPART